MEEKTEGLLLRSIPYLGRKNILKVFTPEQGLLSFFLKKSALSSFSNPFLIAEWVFKKGKEEIHSLQDATLVDDLSDLRKDFTTLSAAGQIAQDLLRSQLPSKRGGALYTLAIAYLKKLPHAARPYNIALSFRLKLLLHEGLLSIENKCSACEELPLFLISGESFCPFHAKGEFGGPTLSFRIEEWETLQTLTYARQFDQIQSPEISLSLKGKIDSLFEGKIR